MDENASMKLMTMSGILANDPNMAHNYTAQLEQRKEQEDLARLQPIYQRFEGWSRFKAGAALEVDWHGKVVWEISRKDAGIIVSDQLGKHPMSLANRPRIRGCGVTGLAGGYANETH